MLASELYQILNRIETELSQTHPELPIPAPTAVINISRTEKCFIAPTPTATVCKNAWVNPATNICASTAPLPGNNIFATVNATIPIAC
jgi:hypothetical protein